MQTRPDVPEKASGLGWVTGFCLATLVAGLLWWLVIDQPHSAALARASDCADNLRRVAKAYLSSRQDSRGSQRQSLQALTSLGSGNSLSPRQLLCPFSKQAYVLVPPSPHPDPRDVLIYEPQDRHRGLVGGNVAYADGHVVWRTPQQLDADLKATHRRQGVIAEPSHR